MTTAIQQRRQWREDFLRMFYGLVQGKQGIPLAPMKWKGIAAHLTMPDSEVGDILQYWMGEQVLDRQLATESYSMTHKGVVLVEGLIEPSSPGPAAIAFGPNRSEQSMARTAFVLNILIASPSDVGEERNVVTELINEWNAVDYRTTNILLRPVRWETHSYPASGDRPQAIVNRQIVDDSDIVIGIFGYRLGTPTGEAQSGTIEEIERLRKAGKHVALYFSTADVPRDADREQLMALAAYQRERLKDTLYDTFKIPDDLRRSVSRHLPLIVSEVFKKLQSSGTFEQDFHRSEASSRNRLIEMADRLRQQVVEPKPLQLNVETVGEFPDGPRLRVTANRTITLAQIDYLDERNVRIAAERLSDIGGQDFEAPLNHLRLIEIHNLKPRTTPEVIPITLRLHILDGTNTITQEIPAAMQPSFKNIGGTTTYFMKLIG